MTNTDVIDFEFNVTPRAMLLAANLLRSLTVDDLHSAGFSEQDIDDFEPFFNEVNYIVENHEACSSMYPE